GVLPKVLRRESQVDREIPDNNNVGLVDEIAVAELQTIAGLQVGVDISHPWRGDLKVTLTTPWGVVIELHPKNQGGSADDLKVTYDETSLPALATLRGRSTQGAWKLAVQDLAPADVGRLNRWWLEFVSAGGGSAPITLQESPGSMIPDNSNAGIERTLPTNE